LNMSAALNLIKLLEMLATVLDHFWISDALIRNADTIKDMDQK
jgi:hypothetical protein